MRLSWRLFWTLLAVVEGAVVLLVAAVLLEVGAKPCHDVIFVEVTAACGPPTAGSWAAVWAAPLLGAVLGLLVARGALGTRR